MADTIRILDIPMPTLDEIKAQLERVQTQDRLRRAAGHPVIRVIDYLSILPARGAHHE